MTQEKDSPKSDFAKRRAREDKMVYRLNQLRVVMLVGLMCLVPVGIFYLQTSIGYVGLVLNLGLIYYFLKELTYEP